MSVIWIGPLPSVVVRDPEMVKEVMSNKSVHFKSPPVNPLIQTLSRGLASLEGEEWARRRKIISPAFHVEKLKVCLATLLCIYHDKGRLTSFSYSDMSAYRPGLSHNEFTMPVCLAGDGSSISNQLH